jgi:hypothetical protein
MILCYFIFSQRAGDTIGSEGAIELSEALKLNTTLTSLDLISNND